jgi:hypothetical protein
MSDGRGDAAAVEIDDASILTAREGDVPVKGIATVCIEQAKVKQEITRITLSGEMPAQAPTGGVADAQFLDRGGIV